MITTIRKIYKSNLLDFSKFISITLLIIQIPIFYTLKLFGIQNKGYEK